MTDLRTYTNREGLIIQGCAGPAEKWVDLMNEMFAHTGILLKGTKFEYEDCVSFDNGDIPCILLEFTRELKIDINKLAKWRLFTYSDLSGKWLSDFIVNRLGGSYATQPFKLRRRYER